MNCGSIDEHGVRDAAELVVKRLLAEATLVDLGRHVVVGVVLEAANRAVGVGDLRQVARGVVGQLHHAARGIGHCSDAAVETGNGALGTWSADMPAILGAPIDHVMATQQWRATGSLVLRSLDGSGSDHRPLIVQYDPAG